MFKKFTQADISLSKRKGGSGSGLAISKEIIESFGAKLKFTSEANKETVFYFDLPFID